MDGISDDGVPQITITGTKPSSGWSPAEQEVGTMFQIASVGVTAAIPIGQIAGWGWRAGLNGGSNSVFWSGYRLGAKGAAQALGKTIEQTPIGAVMNTVEGALQNTLGKGLPGSWWNAASATFANNATGTATAVIRELGPTWTNIELPILTRLGIPINYVP